LANGMGRIVMGRARRIGRWSAVGAAVLLGLGGVGGPAAGAGPAGPAGPPGSLDPSFGGDGVVTTDVSEGFDTASAVAVQRDGRIVAAGGATDDTALVRYRPDGRLDPSFGSGGIVVTPLSDALDMASDVLVQRDGRILVAGLSVGSHQDIAVVRYRADGRLDRSFGTGGVVVTDVAGGADSAGGVAVQRDGRIVVGGSVSPSPTGGSAIGVARYLPDGRPDPSFGDGGLVVVGSGGPALGGDDVAVDGAGRIVVAGSSLDGLLAARLLADGTPDPSFGGGDGLAPASFGRFTSAGGLALGPDGTIVLAGQVIVDTRGPWRVGVARLLADGSLDPSFGTAGTVTTEVTGRDGANDVLVQPGGSVLAVGEAQGEVLLVRYTAAGGLDPAFGGGDGVATAGTPEGADAGRGAALHPGHRVVVGGTFGGDVAVARFHLGAG
jgi:uncharacterized delta-60 repeat protein